MKQKCSFILKASTALVLALLMLFGTVASSVAAVVDDYADTGAQADVADEGAAVDVSDTGWWSGDYYIYNNISKNGWSTGSPKCSVDSSVKYYYIFYVKYSEGDSHQLRYRYYSSSGSKTIAPDSSSYATGSNHSNVHDYSSTDNYYYHTMTNNTKWQRILVGFDTTGNNNAGYVWSSLTSLNDLSATCTAASTTINKGNGVKLTGSCSGDFSSSYFDDGAGGKKAVYTYQYSTNGTSWTDIGSKQTVTGSGAGTDSTGVTFTPSSAGTYYVRVIVNDGNVTKDTNAKNDRYATSGNVTITVKETYAVTYDGNGKTGGTVPSTQTKVQGTALNLATNSLTKTGYTANGWNTNASGTGTHYNNGASYTTDAALPLYAQWTPKTSALTFNLNGGSGTAQTGLTATYGSAMPSYTNAKPTKTGYTFDGFYDDASSGTQYYTSKLASARTWNKDTTSGTTLYAHWTEVKAGAKVAAYTNGSESGTGGKVKNSSTGSAVASFTLSEDFGIGTAKDVLVASTATGYSFKGWQFSGTDDYWTHIRYSFDNSTWYTPEDKDTTYGTSSNTTLYIKTDGASGLTNSNTLIKAIFEGNKHNVTVTQKYYDNETIQTGNKATVTGAANNVSYGTSVTLSVSNIDSNYEFVGWYTAGAADTATAVSTATSYTFSMPDGNKNFEARFRKKYWLTAYSSWIPVGGDFSKIAAPPTKIVVKNGTTTIATYTYAHNNATQGEDAALITSTGTFNEGNKLQILGGYTVEMYYSALGSSEAIRGIFFNNGIRYTTENQAHNMYANGADVGAGNGQDDDWKYTYLADTTLFADENLYSDSETVQNTTASTAGMKIPAAIAANKSGYKATIDQDTHVVTFTAAQNYRNIDIELGSKFRVFFADADDAIIQSKNMDNYYNMGEQMSGSTATEFFTIKAAGNADKITTIDKTQIKVYPADDQGNKTANTPITPFTFKYSSGSAAISNSGTSDSTAYIKIEGTMPNQNVVIELNATTKYNMYLDSKIIADGVANKTKFNQVAKIQAKKSNNSFQLQAYNSSTAGTLVGPNTVNSGETVQYTYTFQSESGTDWKNFYTFVGWYTGDATGPNLDTGYITDKPTLNYTPRKTTYMYAVGTRDLYINGSKYITGADYDWNRTGNNDPVNFKMSFDPNLGSNGKYYWTITPTMYNRVSSTGFTFGAGIESSGEYKQWKDDSNKGNAWFQFMDEATGWNRGAVWYSPNTDSGANLEKLYSDTNGKITYGRIRGKSDWKDQLGAIQFKTENSPGYAPPLTIYYEPGVDAKGTFTVEPSYVYPNIYLSHGYAVGSTTRLATATGTYQSELKLLNGTTETAVSVTGNGWTPNHEGHVNHYKVPQENAKVRIKKTVNAADKVSAFFVYDLYENKVYALRDVQKSSNTYYVDVQLQTGHDLYICPIIEAGGSNMTVYFDSTQLNTNRWGKIVSCYAWYGSGNAQGEFPGQPMIPSDDGTSWVATFPSTKGGSELTGITFSNYVDGGNRENTNEYHGHSWLAEPGVMPSVTDHKNGVIDTSSSLLKFKYNDMGTADDGNTDYRRINCKVQTYDYREPISYFKNNQSVDHADNLTLTFAIKMGNSDSVMSLRHSELKTGSLNGTGTANIFTGITHTHSNGSTTSTHKFTSKNFQYLTNAKGDKYTDLNGVPMTNKPTATYYVIAKGEVVYDTSGKLQQVFWSGRRNESRAVIDYGNDDGGYAINSVPTSGKVEEKYDGLAGMNYGVQWYVYDASGNYITNVLSAGYADYESLTGTVDTDSVVGARLKSLGYAVDGKSVAICYDKPRYMYGDWGDPKKINSGTDFDSFRATGQWYKNEEYQTATVSVGVGMMTDSGEVLADTNDGGYGSAWVRYDTTKGTLSAYASPTPLGNPYPAVTAAQKDAVNTPIRLDASHENFQGWYYYDPGTNEFTKASYTSPDDFRPNYTKDIKYYAIYRAAAIYKYKYQGRQGDDYYTVSGGDLTAAELEDNLVRTTETIRQTGGKYAVGTLAPGSNEVSVFKKTLNFSAQTTYDNTTPYFLNIGLVTADWSNFTLTYYYPETKGGSKAVHSINAQYNTTVDLKNIASTVTSNAPEGQQFIGWYEYDPKTDSYGNLLTKQANYGFVITKDQTVAARYAATAPTDDGVWRAYIDDNEVTRQMNSSTTGKYYNDTIVRFRKGENAAAKVPQGAEVGVLILNDGGTNRNITVNDTSKLNTYANGLNGNGATAKIGSAGKTVTKLCKTITDNDGSPLTYYNRYDFALSSDYAAAKGSKYTVYAYVKINDSYTWSAVASGTYTE